MTEREARPAEDTPPAAPRRAAGRTPGGWRGPRRLLSWWWWALVVVPATLAATAWWWVGSAQSLGSALQLAARYLPAGQVLETRDVQGSLLGGGHIGHLRWQSATLTVEAQDLHIGWQWRALLGRTVHIDRLALARLDIASTPAADATASEPLQPLTELTLPVDVDVSFAVQQIHWGGPPALEARALRGRYRYSGAHHLLDLGGVDVAQGHYEGALKLQGPAPMALDLQLRGRVAAPMPEGALPLTVLADARATGTLSGPDARLQAQARLLPETRAGARATMQADARAEIAPWAAQPLLSAHADFRDLDAARLWPGAPTTLLSGQLDAGPARAGAPPPAPSPRAAPAGPRAAAPTPPAVAGSPTVWQARLTARNAASGPWDAQKLPVTAIDASVRNQGSRWDIAEALLQVGEGRLRATGNWSPAPAPWRIDAVLSRMQPSMLHTRLDPAPVSGTAQVEQRAGATRFDAALQAEAAAPARSAGDGLLGGLRIDRVVAQGQWAGGRLSLPTLRIDAGPARLSGKLEAQVDAQSGEGNIDLQVPGATMRLAGLMAPRSGDLQATLAVADAQALQRWAQSLPWIGEMAAGVQAQGSAHLRAQVDGGWQTLQAQFANLQAPVAGLKFEIEADTQRLDLLLPTALAQRLASSAGAGETSAVSATATTPGDPAATPAPPAAAGVPPVAAAPSSGATPAPSSGATPTPATAQRVRIAGLRLRLAGTPAEAALSVEGEATLGTRRLGLDTRASGGLASGGQWQVGLQQLRLRLWDDTARQAAPWQLALGAPLRLTVRQASPQQSLPFNASLQVDAGAASATITGPLPGSVRVDWQPLQFSSHPVVAGSGAGAAGFRLRTQGTLSGLPMAWADALGADLRALNQSGISGDLVFDGAWDIDAGERLRAQVQLARRSGDIQVLAGGGTLVRRIRTEGTGTPSETRYDNGPVAGAVPTPAGVRQAVLQLQATDEAVRVQWTWDSERAGSMNADLRTVVRQTDGAWAWPENAPLSGVLKARLPSIGAWSFLAPPAWRIDGSLDADVTLAGDRNAPRWNGSLRADGLALRIPVEGVDLRDGRLRATLSGNRLQLDEFVLQGGPASRARIAGPSGNLSTVSSEAARDGGTLRVHGDMEWGPGTPTASAIRMGLTADLQSLRLLVRSDRQLSTSGQLRADLQQGQLSLRGRLTVDRGVVILPEESAPSLGSDVRVRSAAKDRETAEKAARLKKTEQAAETRAATPQALKPPDIAVTLNMGNDFAVQGMGITTRLGGEIEVRANAATRSEPRITGEIRTVAGRYRAYGQELDIESGLARFYGPYANPSLDILALRPNIEQRAGVRILGTAESPRVQLYSQPQLAEAETLAWIVLGRSAAGGGADAAVMQQAALALLSGLGPKGGGNFASRFGLDEIGFQRGGSGEDVRSSAITVGKRITDRLYVTYAQSLAGALGTVYIFYDLTQRLALRGQAGTRSAIDLIYTVTFD